MIKRLTASALLAVRLPITRPLALGVCSCKALEFKKINLEIDHDGVPAKKSRPKTVPVPNITLIGPDKQLSVVTLDVATKMSDRRGLKLIKVIDVDTKTQRPVYQMMTANQFLQEDGKNNQNKNKNNSNKLKGEKTVLINCCIGRADLESKVKNVHKWLKKMHEVKVTISGDTSTANEIADKIISMTQEYSRVVQRREKGGSIKFQLLPPLKT